MKTIGIIAEFNPFHNGHKYLIDKAKKITKAENVIVICSGNYVQRGEPAFYDKVTRAQAALQNGADLIIELPVVYATSSAETFAYGAIDLLNKLNCVDYLCFGCETLNINVLPTIAKILINEPVDYQNMLSVYLKNGFSFPKARANALTDYCSDNKLFNSVVLNNILNKSNNILAIEYLKALKKTNSKIKPLAIKRQGSDYNSSELSNNFASATGIREAIFKEKTIENYIPNNCTDLYTDKYINFMDFNPILGYKLLDTKDLSLIYDVSEDLANRISKLKEEYTNPLDFIQLLQSKNYTYSSISRALTHIMLGLKQEDVDFFKNDKCNYYAKILGFNKNSSILSVLKKKSSIDIISKFSTYYKSADKNAKRLLDIELNADSLYRMIYMTKYGENIHNEFTRQIVII